MSGLRLAVVKRRVSVWLRIMEQFGNSDISNGGFLGLNGAAKSTEQSDRPPSRHLRKTVISFDTMDPKLEADLSTVWNG